MCARGDSRIQSLGGGGYKQYIVQYTVCKCFLLRGSNLKKTVFLSKPPRIRWRLRTTTKMTKDIRSLAGSWQCVGAPKLCFWCYVMCVCVCVHCNILEAVEAFLMLWRYNAQKIILKCNMLATSWTNFVSLSTPQKTLTSNMHWIIYIIHMLCIYIFSYK